MSSLSSDFDNSKLFILTRNRRRVLKRIKRRKEPSIIVYDYYTFADILYLKMPSGRGKLIYVECRRKGVLCVLMS